MFYVRGGGDWKLWREVRAPQAQETARRFGEITWADGNNTYKFSNRNYTGKIRCLRESQVITCAQLGVRLKMKDVCFLRRTTIGLKTKYERKYIGSTQLYYPNSIKTFRLIAVCGDVKLKAWIQDRGKETTSTNTNTKEKKQRCKYPCDDCLKPVRNNQNAILCTECTQWYQIRCTGISLKLFQSYYLTPITKKIGVVLAVHCRNCRSLSLMIW